MTLNMPEHNADLLWRPLYAHLATVMPNGSPHVSPMWFSWDGEFIRFTHTIGRLKYRSIAENPEIAVSINDPQRPYHYIELRGTVERIDPDPEGTFFVELAKRYEAPFGTNPPPDAADRVVLVVCPSKALPKDPNPGDVAQQRLNQGA